MMMKKVSLILFLIGIAFSASAQKERKLVREGNDLYDKQDFEKAEVEYRKALDKKTDSYEAAFNLGDALFKQKRFDEALKQFSDLAEKEMDKQRLGELYHNIGNTLLSMQKTEESIEAYKESLRNRPNAPETKYNLEYARRRQQQQQNQDQNQDQNKDQNKDQQKDQDQGKNEEQQKDQQDQNKDQQDQNKDQQDKNQKDQDKNQQNKDQQQQNQQPQQQPGKISKEDAQRLLEALQNDEKKVQEKVQKEKVQQQKAKKQKIEKDW